jgi:hypothetical protein
MTTADPAGYAWMDDELAWFGVAGCVTVATTVTRQELAEAFGADLASPILGVDEDPPGYYGESFDDTMMVSFTELSGCQVAIEVNGFTGNQGEVLAAASSNGLAASAFWNVDSMVYFSFARDGEVLYSEEYVFDTERDGLPAELIPLVDLVADDGTSDLDSMAEDGPSWSHVAMAMVETVTGVRITPDDVRRAVQRAFAIGD